MPKRKFGYEIIVECDTEFKEDVISGVIENTIRGLSMYKDTGKMKKYKVLWRRLQPDEL